MSKPLLLMILDGWGERHACCDNAITSAEPKNFISLEQNYPHTLLKCSGKEVGLPAGLMGNSEVGHLNIGSGRVVYQEISRLFNAIEDHSFFENKEFLKAMEFAQAHNGAVHLMGLLSDGGVHSHIEHIYALLELCAQKQIKSVFVHAFLDGRDVGPKTALGFIESLQGKMRALGCGQIATLGGRYYGMDRDKHWDRIEKAYNALVLGEGKNAANAQAALENSYESRVTDEFVEPVVLVDQHSQPLGLVQDGDAVIFFNFRADRARQITRAFVEQDFNGFNRRKKPDIYYVCMTQYDVNIDAPVAFMPQDLTNTLGEVLSQNGLKQLRIAETEKYAHVTFFFNGGVEAANPGEDRILIPSPAVATYNLAPQMSAPQVTQRVLEELDRDYYDVVILNYANADMVGHTGVLEAAVEAVKTVDDCLGQVVDRVLNKNGTVLITADHGNCEMMVSPETGSPFTAHTTSRVPFILVSKEHRNATLKENGALRDIAPTILSLLDLPIPAEMTGQCLIE
jgi:2,3-bisphosphoglycerate-independent phosphoglycerate mutase